MIPYVTEGLGVTVGILGLIAYIESGTIDSLRKDLVICETEKKIYINGVQTLTDAINLQNDEIEKYRVDVEAAEDVKIAEINKAKAKIAKLMDEVEKERNKPNSTRSECEDVIYILEHIDNSYVN